MEIKEILKQALLKSKPEKTEMDAMKKEVEGFFSYLKEIIKKKKIKADVFLGGSLAKSTVIRKKKYDADIFVRFDKSYDEKEMMKKFEQIGSSIKLKGEKIHGSRDYYRFYGDKMFFEIVPVTKISKPDQARNTTDLSYFHVSYILDKIKKNKKLPDEIILAKAFAYSSGCYGAESHIGGFSGYSLEIAVSHYGSFLKFIKALSQSKERIIIDPSKQYKNKADILENVNESKIEGPFILIDPTYKNRNALSALSISTFDKFKLACQDFLKHPNIMYFEKIHFNEADFAKKAKSPNTEFIKIQILTDKQEGSIAGAKLLKFYNFLAYTLEKYFEIKEKEFVYDDGKTAQVYFILKRKPLIIFHGPPLGSGEHEAKFRKKHKKVYVKDNKLYSEEINPVSSKNINKLIDKDILESMSIIDVLVD